MVIICSVIHKLLFFFFFQAEDGIRDGTVTGVQTCALPIYHRAGLHLTRCPGGSDRVRGEAPTGVAGTMTDRSGPLAGVRVIELGGIGPVPFAAMLLADLGSDVITVRRPDDAAVGNPVLSRGRRSIAVNLKDPRGVDVVHSLIADSDALIEGFRPGVAERLGFDPGELRKANPALVVGRMTGYGQDGPLAQRAGHDIDYIALSGALA